METQYSREHSINYKSNLLTVTGVKEVISFEDKEIVIDLDNGGMTIKGEGLTVSEMSVKSGMLRVEGEMKSLAYSSSLAKTGLIKKLFK